ncbi:MAG: hypothetical protein ACK48Y_12445, partial [Planctomyces sp.]
MSRRLTYTFTPGLNIVPSGATMVTAGLSMTRRRPGGLSLLLFSWVHPGLLWVQTETTAVEEDC